MAPMLALVSFGDLGWLLDRNWYLVSFWLVFLLKSVRLWINCFVVYFRYKPTRPQLDPMYSSHDVTAILPTISQDLTELAKTIESVYKLEPRELILVTVDANYKRIAEMVESLYSSKGIRVMSISQANKRRQLCHAIPEVQTRFILLADDDVIMPPKFMKWALAPFEDHQMGGVGTCQRLTRKDRPNNWDFLSALYLERRNFDCCATNWMDGGLPCLSGRAVMYRSCILQDPEFRHAFTHETWRGNYQLNADDDNFITRRLMANNWDIKFQWHPDCEVKTVLEGNPKYLKQCTRWVRSNWRSNLTSMFVERHVWRQFPYTCYAVFQTTLTAWAIPYDALLCYLLFRVLATPEWHEDERLRYAAMTAFFAHWLVSKFIKLLGHYTRYPQDSILLPVSILFGYFHSFLKAYGLLTLDATTWGSREGADADDNYRMRRLPLEEELSLDPQAKLEYYRDLITSDRTA